MRRGVTVGVVWVGVVQHGGVAVWRWFDGDINDVENTINFEKKDLNQDWRSQDQKRCMVQKPCPLYSTMASDWYIVARLLY